MSKFSSIAVIGAGGIGKYIIASLSQTTAKTIVLTRAGSAPKDVPENVKVISVNYSDVSAVTDILRENSVEVVVSTLGAPAIHLQESLADAAKAAGVQLFAPSEYGMPTDGITEGPLAGKEQVAKHLKSIGLPSARFYVGIFGGFVGWMLGFNENGKVNYTGSGNVPFSVTVEEDIGGFVAHVITTLPPAELQDKIFRLEGQRVTVLDIAKLLKTTAVPVDKIPGDNAPGLVGFKGYIQEMIEVGAVSTGYHPETKIDTGLAGSTNKYWEGHKWSHFEDSAA